MASMRVALSRVVALPAACAVLGETTRTEFDSDVLGHTAMESASNFRSVSDFELERCLIGMTSRAPWDERDIVARDGEVDLVSTTLSEIVGQRRSELTVGSYRLQQTTQVRLDVSCYTEVTPPLNDELCVFSLSSTTHIRAR